mgnify:CR=1 FL=1
MFAAQAEEPAPKKAPAEKREKTVSPNRKGIPNKRR